MYTENKVRILMVEEGEVLLKEMTQRWLVTFGDMRNIFQVIGMAIFLYREYLLNS